MKSLVLLIIGTLTLASVYAQEPESFAEFKQEVGDAQERIDYSKHLLKHDELHKFIPEPDRREESDRGSMEDGQSRPGIPSAGADSKRPPSADPTPNEVNAPDKDESGHESAAPESVPKEAKPAENVSRHTATAPSSAGLSASRNLYIAPSLRRSSGENAVSNTAAVDQPEVRAVIFGIRIGTEIRVELVSGASNVQSGLMKFRVTRTVTGDKRSLPLNTLLFARPTAVLGSPRLFMSQTMKGITPDGKEFMLRASIRANDLQPGLMAYVVNDGKTLYRAASEGKTALAENLLSLAPDGIIVDAGKAAAGQVLQEQQGESRAKYGSGVYVVQANPQPAVIEIEETF
jgi:hypothetical protein